MTVLKLYDFDRDRETVQEKIEAEIRCEQQAQQMKEESKCDGIDCAWCDIVECPREVNNDRK